MAMFDQEEIKSLEAGQKEGVLDVMKSTIMQLCVQLGEAVDESCVENFIKWLQESIAITNSSSELMAAFEKSKDLREMNKESMKAIREDTKALFLLESSIISDGPDKHIKAGDEDKCDYKSSIDFNQFLYDDVNEVLRSNKVHSVYKCEHCQSTDVVPRPLISHSASVESLLQLFTFLSPDFSEMKLLDIGSGLGSILYGAYYFSNASKLYGVELNEGFCNIVKTVIDKYKLSDRIEIINSDLMARADLLKTADVVTFNNVLEYFAPIEAQKAIWLFLRRHMRVGAIFVTNPDLVSLLSPLNMESLINSWVTSLKPKVNPIITSGFPETDEQFHLYKVISSED